MRAIGFFATFLFAATFLHGCLAPDYQTHIYWHIENKTDRTVKVSFMTSENHGDTKTIGPYKTVSFSKDTETRHALGEAESFSHFPARDECYLYSDDELFRIWRQSERNDGGKQFFNRRSWSCTPEGTGVPTYNWWFEIDDEDLAYR